MRSWTILMALYAQLSWATGFTNGAMLSRDLKLHNNNRRRSSRRINTMKNLREASRISICMQQLQQSHTQTSTLKRHSNLSWSMLYRMRGGATLKVSQDESPASDQQPTRRKRTIALWAVSISALSYLVIDNKKAIAKFSDKDHLQATVLNLLHSVEEQGPYGVVLYTLGMAVWELFGMTTIPVETAAGMAFGFRRGFVASALGKMLGAVSGYVLGKTLLHDFVRSKLQDNKVLKLIDGHVQAQPLRTAFLMRYSVLPEAIKNCGASLFPPLKFWMFVLSIMFHGWLYSAVWTYLGVDTARRLEDPHLPVDLLLKFSISAATFVGMILTPLIMAWWIRDMQESELNTIEAEDE